MAVVQADPQLQPPSALWVLSSLILVFWFWAWCATCHRKSRRRQQSGLKLVDVSLLRQTQLRSLSKSDSKLHELNQGPRNSKAQRPTSVDLLYPRWPGGIRAEVQMTTVPPVFIHRELPQPPLVSDSLVLESTYSNVRLTVAPRAPPITQMGEKQLRISEKLVLAEYASVQKIKKGSEVGPSMTGPSDSIPGERGVQQPEKAAEVEVLYSKISKLGRKALEPTCNRALCSQLNRNTQASLKETANEQSLSPATNSCHGTSCPTWDRNTGKGPTENFYESISEMQELGKIALPRLPAEAQNHRPCEDL